MLILFILEPFVMLLLYLPDLRLLLLHYLWQLHLDVIRMVTHRTVSSQVEICGALTCHR